MPREAMPGNAGAASVFLAFFRFGLFSLSVAMHAGFLQILHELFVNAFSFELLLYSLKLGLFF